MKAVPLSVIADRTCLSMPGLEPDCLLAWLALMGLLRSLEHARPDWNPRASWSGPPWIPALHVSEKVSQQEVAVAVCEGIASIASCFDVDDKRDVSFTRPEYRDYAYRCRENPVAAALVAALSSEVPLTRKTKSLLAAPLVMMFGQGHQHFLERLVTVARGDSGRSRKKAASEHSGPEKIEQALFAAWTRTDATPGMRWDPDEDQRYALRFKAPTAEGGAPTVHGANRLACVGLLSFTTVPTEPLQSVVGARRDEWGAVDFVWPIWRGAISLRTIEALLVHPDVLSQRLGRLSGLGVVEVYSSRRVQNLKYLNVARGSPARDR